MVPRPSTLSFHPRQPAQIEMGLSLDFPLEVEIGTSPESFQKALESQQALFHRQVGQLQNIVITQCKLSGANPLSQEMAAGALSIKIGKRPRDLLNPKAVEYLHSVFSVKDVITKKESRDIAVRFGMTVTQVKEFFANQKSRVRKFVRLSTEKAAKIRDSNEPHDEMLCGSNEMVLIDPVPLNRIGPSTSEETASGLNQEEVPDGIDELEKYFVNNTFSMMRKEESFTGQVKLMEWILRMKNPSVLCWLLVNGGLMILVTWLSQAATEEQTSVITVALEVLSHLPLNKALPVHMSAAIQGVNSLRFYPKSDISGRARVLLSRWSKMFAKTQVMNKPNGIKSFSDAPKGIDLKQRICDLMGDESWQSTNNMTGDSCSPYGAGDETRPLEPQQSIKLLPALADDSARKQALGSIYKERRKVLLVEQPGQKTAKNHVAPKAVNSTQARPVTADEIQKAKLRAQYMQNKHSKIGSSSGSCKLKSEGPKRPSTSLLTNDLLSASEAYLHPKLEANKKGRFGPSKSNKLAEVSSDVKLTAEPNKISVDSAERLRRIQLPWKRPPEVKLDASWKVAAGEDSKEMEVQRNRVHREKETFYDTPQEIPPNPKDPWDIEMDYDDTLTPEIPIDQLPDDTTATTPQEEPIAPPINLTAATPTPTATTSSTSSSQAQSSVPDLNLLALLLKNPQLVFALTSGQNIGLPNVDHAKLLDVLKLATGSDVGSSNTSGTPNGFALRNHNQTPDGFALKNHNQTPDGFALKNHNQTEEVAMSLPSPTPTIPSLPSPTPHSSSRYDDVTSLPSPTPSIPPPPPPLNGWRQQAAAAAAQKNPFSRQVTTVPGPNSSTIASQPPRLTTRQTGLMQNGFATAAPDNFAPALSSSWSHAPATFRQETTQHVHHHEPNQTPPRTDYYRQQHHIMRDAPPDRGNTSLSFSGQQFPERFPPETDLRNLLKAKQGLSPSFHQGRGSNSIHSGVDEPSSRYDGKNQSRGGSGYRLSLSPESNPNRYTDHHRDDRGHRYGYQQQEMVHGSDDREPRRYGYQQQEMIHGRGYGGQEDDSQGRNSRYNRGHDNNSNWHRGGRRWNDRMR